MRNSFQRKQLDLRLEIPLRLFQLHARSLRNTFNDLIPPQNQRVPKKGFNVPLGNWMRNKLDRYFDELMPRDYVKQQGIFCYETITQMRQEHQRGSRDNSYELFSILMFDAWYRKYILLNV